MTMSQESVVEQESGDADMGPMVLIKNRCVSKGVSAEGARGGGEEVGGGKGKGRAEVLPYEVFVTDCAGALVSKATQQAVRYRFVTGSRDGCAFVCSPPCLCPFRQGVVLCNLCSQSTDK